ncbi:hypothetical protein BC831DRAFT_444532, partial [Entophlyctis helioformis]
MPALPNELVLHVLAHADPQTVTRCEQTCRQWRSLSLSHDTAVWLPLLVSHVYSRMIIPPAVTHPAQSATHDDWATNADPAKTHSHLPPAGIRDGCLCACDQARPRRVVEEHPQAVVLVEPAVAAAQGRQPLGRRHRASGAGQPAAIAFAIAALSPQSQPWMASSPPSTSPSHGRLPVTSALSAALRPTAGVPSLHSHGLQATAPEALSMPLPHPALPVWTLGSRHVVADAHRNLNAPLAVPHGQAVSPETAFGSPLSDTSAASMDTSPDDFVAADTRRADTPADVLFRIKAARIGTGTISLPITFTADDGGDYDADYGFRRRRSRRSWVIPSPTLTPPTPSGFPPALNARLPPAHTIPRQQVWLDNGGTPAETDPLCIITPSRPHNVSVRLVPQVRSDLFMMEEAAPDSALVTLRIWDPRLHPSGPWMACDTSPASASSPHMVRDVHGCMRVKGLWVLPNQVRGAALCGRTLVCRTMDSAFIHAGLQDAAHEFPEQHCHGVRCWVLEDVTETDDMMDSWMHTSPELPPLFAASPTAGSPGTGSQQHLHGHADVQGSPMRVAWEKYDPSCSIQEVVCNETVVVVRLVASQWTPPVAPPQDAEDAPFNNGFMDMPPQQPPPTRPDAALVTVLLWRVSDGSLLADLTSDIPASTFMRGSGIFRMTLTRFHLVLYNWTIMAVYD